MECAGRAPTEPSIQAGLTSETGNLSCMLHHLPHGVLPLSSLLNRSPQTISSPLLCSPLIQPPLQAAVNSSFYGRGWLHSVLSAHSRPFTTTHSLYCMCVCVCVHLWLSVCEHVCTSVCILCTTCPACLLKLLF